jgi:hypothetical protein
MKLSLVRLLKNLEYRQGVSLGALTSRVPEDKDAKVQSNEGWDLTWHSWGVLAVKETQGERRAWVIPSALLSSPPEVLAGEELPLPRGKK